MNNKILSNPIAAIVALAFSMVYLDITVLSVALPSIQNMLNTTSGKVLWVANIYMLMRAILVFASGQLSDIFGHAKTFTTGLILFLLSSLGCALASNVEMLIIFRCLQGIGATFIFVPGMSLITSSLPDNQRGQGIGFVLSISLASMAAGPIISGLFVTYLSWRWIFIANVLVSFIALVLIYPKISTIKRSANGGKFDWFGFALSVIFTFCATVAFENSNAWGWSSPKFIINMAIAFLVMILFIFFEKRKDAPIVNMNLFALPNFFAGCLIASFVQVGVLMIIFLGIYFQNALGFTPLMAGVGLMPMVVTGVIFSNIGGRLADKYGAKVPLIMGTSAIIFGFIITLTLFKNISYFTLIPLLICSGIGMFMISGPVRTAMLYQTPKNMHGMTNAILTGMRSIISVIGFAIISAIIININFFEAKANLKKLIPSISDSQTHNLLGLLSNTIKSKSLLNTFDLNQQLAIKSIVLQSYVNSFFWALIFVGCLILISFILSVFYIEKKSPQTVQ